MKSSLAIILATVAGMSATLAASPDTAVDVEDVQNADNILVKPALWCPRRPVSVRCFRDPCWPNPCGRWNYCCPDYSYGCNYTCRRRRQESVT
jgi:hypothetical protein